MSIEDTNITEPEDAGFFGSATFDYIKTYNPISL